MAAKHEDVRLFGCELNIYNSVPHNSVVLVRRPQEHLLVTAQRSKQYVRTQIRPGQRCGAELLADQQWHGTAEEHAGADAAREYYMKVVVRASELIANCAAECVYR